MGGNYHETITPYASLQPLGSSFEEYRDSLVEWAERAKNLGFNIPNTEYSKGDGKQLKVVKPIDGGMYTEEGTSTKYSCIIQEKIIGYNKRLYLINDKIYLVLL